MKYLKRIVVITLFSLLCLPSLQAAVIILISDLQLFDRIEPDKKIIPIWDRTDMDEYVKMIQLRSEFAKKYDMEIYLSLLSTHDLGPAHKNQTNEAGRWLGYKVGVMNASAGSFSLPMWQQMYWTNNKGMFPIKLKNIKAYAFKEKPVKASHFVAVNPDEIVKIKDVQWEGGNLTFHLDNTLSGK